MRNRATWTRSMARSQSKIGATEEQQKQGTLVNEVSANQLKPRVVSEIRSQIIEIPTIEEVVTYLTKKEYVEVEKRVPKVEVHYVQKTVEVPQIHIVDQLEEVPEYREVVKYMPLVEVVKVPQEVVRYVPKIEIKRVERCVEVPGKPIEVKRPYIVERPEPYPVYKDKEVNCVVAQKLIPVVSESPDDHLDVEVVKYVPILIPVDVYVPRPIEVPLVPYKKSRDTHRKVDVPVPQYNTLLINLNSHMSKDSNLINELPFQKSSDGAIPLLVPDQYNSVITVLQG